MSDGKVVASIETIVNDLKIVSWEQVIYEAITNSLQANATDIKIKFFQNSLNIEETKGYIESIIIEDNGDGFNEKNTKSFQEYRSKHKIDLGCKGIGRFLFLKMFDEVNIRSLDKNIKFAINKDIKVTKENKVIDKTIVKFLKPKNDFTVDYNLFSDELKDYFIAYFKLLNDKNLSIKIIIYENELEKSNIESNNIPKFTNKQFKIKNHEFNISYILNDKAIKDYDGYYCAGDRVVIKNSFLEYKKKLKFFKNIKILYLLTSKYMDNNVNSTRDDFTIFPVFKNSDDLFNSLSWKEIQNELKNQIREISLSNGIDIDKIAKENLNTAIKEAPFLAYYLQDNDNDEDSLTLKKKAKKKLEEDKDFLRNNSDKTNNEYQKKLSIITQSELSEYIFDRQKTIERLKELVNDQVLEKEIHNLFMKQSTKDENQNYKSNNLWLFDDRFMIYDKVFSDKQIKEIFPKLSENIDRPDILSIVSNTDKKDDITDIVIIELKRPNKNITPAGAEEELLKYSRYVQESNFKNKIRIWTYAFLKYNNDTDSLLGDKDYNKIPTHSEYPIYYKYHGKRNTIINFMDFRALAFDADTRNKTFMKILEGDTI
jgi:anti-sigma regulatory factor (Ser/Thr protein kinase)